MASTLQRSRTVAAAVTIEMTETKCPRCFQPVFPDDTLAFEGSQLMHFDCGRPRDLSRQERVLLFGHCWGHQMACPACGHEFRLFELSPNRFERCNPTCCPRCRIDLIASVREHLYACPLSPEVLRRQAHEARENMRRLVKQVRELTRQADVAAGELLGARKQSASETVRRTIKVKLHAGGLPQVDVPGPTRACAGDGSKCAACEQPISQQHLMVILVSGATGTAFHASDCFSLWDEERRSLRSTPRFAAMPDEPILRDKAREAIHSGRLPTAKPGRTFGGPSSGAVCAICGEPVPRGETEFKVQFAVPEAGHYLHVRCFAAWELERTNITGASIS